MLSSRIVSFSSGKGGVGKTSVVVSLGHLWASSGKKTLLIDGDWNLGKLAITLGVKPKYTIENVLSGEVPLQEAILPIKPNLFLLAAPSGYISTEKLNEDVKNHLFFELDSLAGQYERLLFDHSSGVHSEVLWFAAACHQHVVVTTTEPTSYADAYAIMKLLSKNYHIRSFQLVVTLADHVGESHMAASRFCEVVHKNLDCQVRILDVLPRELKMSEAIRAGQPFVLKFPTNPLVGQFKKVCADLDRQKESNHSGLQFFIQNRINEITG